MPYNIIGSVLEFERLSSEYQKPSQSQKAQTAAQWTNQNSMENTYIWCQARENMSD